MNDRISSLTAEQAQRALLTFFDLLPDDLWKDQSKPSVARLETLADRMEGSAPDEVRAALKILRSEGNAGVKGEVAKVILDACRGQDALLPYVEQALAKSSEPHMMAIDPVTIGVIITVLAALSSKYRKTSTDKRGKKTEVVFEGGGAKLIDSFTGFVKALPKKLLEKLA